MMGSMGYEDAERAYTGSSRDLTVALFARLHRIGPVGHVAVNVFRAQKASERAKVYRGGRGGRSFRSQAYERKAWAMDQLCQCLDDVAPLFDTAWGWGIDDKQPVHRHVLYVDLPTGQVSWHTDARGRGPDYPGRWDGVARAVPARLLEWIGNLLDDASARQIVGAHP